MATFTKTPESETPVISVNHLNRIAKINDNVYGGFTEYVECLCLYLLSIYLSIRCLQSDPKMTTISRRLCIVPEQELQPSSYLIQSFERVAMNLTE